MPSSISTLQALGVPSSSMVSDPRRSSSVPSSTTVTPGAATRCPIRPANAEVCLRLKSPSRPWPIASWSSTPGQPGPSTTVISPAGAATDSRLTSAWRSASSTIDCHLAGQQLVVADPAAGAEAAGLHPLAVADHDLDVEPDQRPDIRAAGAVGAQDLDLLPGAGQAGADLLDPRVLGAGVGIDLLEQADLGRLNLAADRVGLAIALAVGALRRQREAAAVAGLHRGDRVDRALERGEAELGAVGEPDRLAGDRPQTETAAGVERGGLEATVVEGEALGLAILEEQLAVIDAVEAAFDQPLQAVGVARSCSNGPPEGWRSLMKAFGRARRRGGNQARARCITVVQHIGSPVDPW